MGHVTVVGGCRAKAPLTDILARTLPVGSVVKLMENGTAVEYLVVNQGIPGNSNLYDASCDGTWLLRKDCHSKGRWCRREENEYDSSDINTWLNGDFFNSLGSVEQSVIKQVKIPYCAGNLASTINSGTNGLSVKAFLLGGYEVGFTIDDDNALPEDGAKLDYFILGAGGNAKRISYLDGNAVYWWLRSPQWNTVNLVFHVKATGGLINRSPTNSDGIRPALIIPSTAKFDSTTLILKG